MRTTKIICSLLATSVLASACGPVGQEAARNIKTTSAEASSLLPTAAAPMAKKDKSPIKVNDGVFVGSKSIRNVNGDPLPSRFEGPNGVTIVRSYPVGLREISGAITEHTKIPVVVAAATAAGTSGGQNDGEENTNFAIGEMPNDFPINQALAQLSGGGAIEASASGVSAEAIPLNYSGSLSGLLDIVTAHFNVAWRYERGRIVLDRVITRSFDVPALAVASSLEFDLSSKSEQSGQDGATSSAGQLANSKSNNDVFGEIEAGLEGLVADGSYSINRVTGAITVTASPATVQRVADYVSSTNQRLSEQVAVSVKVYSVVLNDNEEFDLDVAGIFNEAGKYGISAGTSGVVPVADGAAGSGLGWALLDNESGWNGSQALVKALSTRGDVSVVTTASVTTVNGVPVPLQVGEMRDYVKEVSITPGSDGAEPTASLTPGTVSTGFSLQIVPRVERNGDILLQYGINISELTGSEDGFETFETMGSKLQLRRINQRNFIQQARVPNSNTLVLAGFEQVRNENQKSGVGRANFPLFGGGARSSMRREIIVIAITPTLLKTD